MLLLWLFFTLLIVSYALFDVNYFIRTAFTVISSRYFEKKCGLTDTTTIYGLCTLQDCDVTFSTTRLCRIVRELDFARYHFYLRSGIQRRSQELNIQSLQGCTLTVTLESIPIFVPYKINSKLVFWDERSLFIEHEIITLFDEKVRALLVSRQYAIREASGNSTEDLLRGFPGYVAEPECLEYLEKWFKSMEISSNKLRAANTGAPRYVNK